MKKFYTYELRDEAGVPFYVGKGSKRRMFEHVYKAKAGQKTRRASKIRSILNRGGKVVPVKVFETDDEQEAFAEEVRLIAHYGRENLKNDTDGGDGPNNMSAEARERIAASRRGKKASDITKQRQREAKLGKPVSEATKAKIAAWHKGKPHPWAKLPRSEEYKQNMRLKMLGRVMPPGTGAKISAAKMGHTVSQETRDKISRSKRGSSPAWNKGIKRTRNANYMKLFDE